MNSRGLMWSSAIALFLTCFAGENGLAGDTVSVDIGSQDLVGAIAELGEKTGRQIIGPDEMLAGRLSTSVSGLMTPKQALTALVNSEGVEIAELSDGTLVISSKQKNPAAIELPGITVFGERVERTVFETPSSIAVITAEELEETPAIQNLEDLLEDVPNIIVFGGGNETPTIRGQASSGALQGGPQILSGTVPRATTSIDGRLLSFNEFAFGTNSVYDVAAVEVFRGPQTTSQGANAIAGAIYIRTNDPTYEFQTEVRAQYQTFDGQQLSGFVNIPIIEDQLALRATGDYRVRDTYVNFLPIANPSKESLEILQGTARVKLLFEPKALPGLSTKLTYSRTHTSNPQSENVDAPFRNLTDTFVGAGGTVASFQTDSHSLIHDIKHVVNDNLTVSNRFVSSWIDVERRLNDPNGQLDLKGTDISNETLANFNLFDGRITGVAGVFYRSFKDDADFFRNNSLAVFDDQKESLGIFGEITTAITDKLDVTAGLRYQRDKQDRLGAIVSGPLSFLPGASDLNFNGTFDAFLPKFVLGYDVTEDVRVGAIVSRGFNPGAGSLAVNSFFSGQLNAFFTYDDETLWNYEAFARANLFDGKVTLAANAFYTDFDDNQLNVPTVAPNGLLDTFVVNAEDAESYGFELSATAQVRENLTAKASAAYLKTEILKFADSPALVGNEFAGAPKYSGTFGLDWAPIENLILGGKVRFNGGYFSDVQNTRANKIDPNAIVDLKVNYAVTENFEIFGFANNVANVIEPVILFNNGSRGRVTTPQEFGGGLRAKF